MLCSSKISVLRAPIPVFPSPRAGQLFSPSEQRVKRRTFGPFCAGLAFEREVDALDATGLGEVEREDSAQECWRAILPDLSSTSARVLALQRAEKRLCQPAALPLLGMGAFCLLQTPSFVSRRLDPTGRLRCFPPSCASSARCSHHTRPQQTESERRTDGCWSPEKDLGLGQVDDEAGLDHRVRAACSRAETR